ncbi:acyl-CoA dehydrogenase family protein [Kribbella sp. NPDC056861]|uniref:acyl-CoA dehydrogenase family protein n=1 Tax=Kribbella sp. NPDC056861 TaxID=3154857 RepID=UPI0034449187
MTPPRDARSVAAELRQLVVDGSLDIPDPGSGRTLERWAALALLGCRDLTLARLGEGHLDAVSILHQAGRTEVPNALYGVWAARSGGTGAVLNDNKLSGTVRFCSGAHGLDRALVAALTPAGESVLLDVDLLDPRILRQTGTWQAVGMDASDSPDVVFADLPVTDEDRVGDPGFYLDRPGFWWGGGGVAAVWYGGARGLVDRTTEYLRSGKGPDEHQLAHLGDLEATLAATASLLQATARLIDDSPSTNVMQEIWVLRAAVERVVRATVDQVPRITGPTPLSRDRDFAQALADLQVYVRQHHAERDLAALGRLISEGKDVTWPPR